MKVHESLGYKVFNFFNIVFLFILMIVTLYPMLYIVFCSFSDPVKLYMHNGMLIKPLGFSLKAYEAVLQYPNILIGYKNTIIILVVGVIVSITLTSLGAYVLSRKNVLWNKAIMIFILITMYISGGLIPIYLNIRQLGLFDTYAALILPTAISTFNLIILRTAFAAIPDSIEESVRVDGANHFTILLRMIIPLAKPTIAVLVLFYGVGIWNSWFYASIFLQDPQKYPLQLVLVTILLQSKTDAIQSLEGGSDQFLLYEALKNAIIVIATVPILVLYPFLQKHFVKGVMIGSVKG